MSASMCEFLRRTFYLSLWRVRIGRLGVGWRSAAWSKWASTHRFRYQRDPVRVWRAWGVWIQWGRYGA